MQNHTFVGVIESDGLSLIQHNTRLYVVNHVVAIEEFAYQLAVRQFGDMPRVNLDPAPSIAELVGIGFDAEDKEGLELSREDVIKRVTQIITAHSPMLDDYFAMRIVDGRLETVPILLSHYEAFGLPVERLPTLLLRLGPQVDWEDEEQCFADICREIAYAHVPSSRGSTDAAWTVQHVWFAHMSGSRARFLPPKRMQGDVVQVAHLPDLCACELTDRVFERC